MLYMLIERFKEGAAPEIYRRLREKGRMMPEGLNYVSSWMAGGVGVVIDSNGHLGTSTSSARYKEAIQPMDKASEAILALKPVTFHYKKELDPDGIPQFGLVAEDVEKVNADLVTRDAKGKVFTVRYEAVNAMLLNEFSKSTAQYKRSRRRLTRSKRSYRSKER
jgi:hypothetical protein